MAVTLPAPRTEAPAAGAADDSAAELAAAPRTAPASATAVAVEAPSSARARRREVMGDMRNSSE